MGGENTYHAPSHARVSHARVAPFLGVMLLGLMILGLMTYCGPLGAQAGPDPDFNLSFTPGIQGTSGSVQTIDAILNVTTAGDPLAGWSYGICHDSTLLATIGATSGDAISTLNNGGPVGFESIEFDPVLGVTHGVVICLTSCASLPPPVNNMTLLSIEVELLAVAGTTTDLEYCNSVAIGGNPVPTILVTTGGGSKIPVTEPGTITVVDVAFQRGDCDTDGNLTIGDAIVALGALFGPGDPLDCTDACDATDDGQLNIADPIRVLSYLFSQGIPPEAPFPLCGVDPTPDPLTCDQPSNGC